MSDYMRFSRKKDWKPGMFAFKIKCFTPDGGMIETVLPRVPVENGEAICEAINKELGRTPGVDVEVKS